MRTEHHLTEFFYAHLANLRRKYQVLIHDDTADDILANAIESVMELEDSISDVRNSENSYFGFKFDFSNPDLSKRQDFVFSVEEDLFTLYYRTEREKELDGLLKECCYPAA